MCDLHHVIQNGLLDLQAEFQIMKRNARQMLGICHSRFSHRSFRLLHWHRLEVGQVDVHVFQPFRVEAPLVHFTDVVECEAHKDTVYPTPELAGIDKEWQLFSKNVDKRLYSKTELCPHRSNCVSSG